VTLDALSLCCAIRHLCDVSFGFWPDNRLHASQFDLSLRAPQFILSRLFKPSSILVLTFDVRFFYFHCFSFLSGRFSFLIPRCELSACSLPRCCCFTFCQCVVGILWTCSSYFCRDMYPSAFGARHPELRRCSFSAAGRFIFDFMFPVAFYFEYFSHCFALPFLLLKGSFFIHSSRQQSFPFYIRLSRTTSHFCLARCIGARHLARRSRPTHSDNFVAVPFLLLAGSF